MRRLLVMKPVLFQVASKKSGAYFLALLLFFTLPAFAQQSRITGKITSSDGSPIAGATVQLKGTGTTVSTGNDGAFSLDAGANSNAVLLVSSVGYASKELPASAGVSVLVALETDVKNLNDVVVVGYGTQKRKDLTGSIATVSAQQVEQRPVSAYQDALAGVAAGIDVSPRSARPGNVAEIRIRGIGSISGDTEPLYVIDGFPTDATNAAAIAPGDIASINILKDASSTAIYGSRGANGVIIITTKSGRAGQSRVDVSLKTGFAKANKNDFYSVLNGAQYVEWYKEKAQFAGTAVPSWVTNWDGTSTNWQDLIYRAAPFSDYNVSVSGGADKFTYMFSGDYLKQEDILLNAGFDKYSARMKMDYKASNRITIGLNVAPNFTVQRLSAPEDDFSSLTGAAVLLPPIIPAYNADGTPSDPNSFGILNNKMANPLTIAQHYQAANKTFTLLTNAYVQVNILKGLSFKSLLGGNVTDNRYNFFRM